MPILKNAKTVYVDNKPWESPDGKVKIWTIKLEINGERNTHSTMSQKIATEGWTGDVEVYTNAKGKDYVRQAPKEEQGSFSGGGKREWKDTSDGQRQGMCFNNAAAYVAANSEKTLTPHQWADAVFKYASALYSKGDLLNLHETDANKPRAEEDKVDEEAISLYKSIAGNEQSIDDEQVDLNDIPF